LPRIPCLARLNGGPWGLRRRVPDELRPILGKREIWKSYGTEDHAKARRLHNREMAVVDAMFAEARRKLAEANGATVQPGANPDLVQASEEDIRAAALAWFHERERQFSSFDRNALRSDEGEEGVDREDVRDNLRADEAGTGSEQGRQWADREARAILARYGFALSEGVHRHLGSGPINRLKRRGEV
jgi:hypothetical protein